MSSSESFALLARGLPAPRTEAQSSRALLQTHSPRLGPSLTLGALCAPRFASLSLAPGSPAHPGAP